MTSELDPTEPTDSVTASRRTFVAGAAAVGAGAVLAACGDSDDDTSGTTAAGSDGETTDGEMTDSETTDGESGGGDEVTFGSNFSDEVPKEAIAAAIAATGVPTSINTVDHNTYQENFNTYIQQPDDVVSWFAGYRMRAFASKGVLGDISDVWDNIDMSEGFKNSATGLDGSQYFVPFYFYAWGIHYRKSLFADNGYEIPETWDELLALCEQMQSDGIIPFAAGNVGNWPQMGTFDMINLRTNGYDFHVSLMGGNEDWTSDEVKQVFTNWEQLLPYYEENANGREFQEAAQTLASNEAGMYLIGNFVTDQYEADVAEDIDFFLFPEINPEHGRDAIEAPIDGFMMAANPANEEGAKELLAGLASAEAIDAYIGVTPSVVAANASADTSGYNALQAKAAEEVGNAKYIAQFLDRDTDPAFASDVVGVGIADFLAGGDIDTILTTIEEQKATFTFE